MSHSRTQSVSSAPVGVSGTTAATVARFPSVDRRRRSERRRFGATTLLHSVRAPRRWRGRRSDDRRFALLDRYDTGLVAMALSLMALSILDATFTLMLLEAGGSELNPVMQWALDRNLWFFAGLKMLLTAVPVVLMVATGNLLLLGRVRVRSLLGALTGAYLALIAYEILLLQSL